MAFRFGVFEFDASSGELRREGRAVRIEPQPARALALLLSKPGTVVTRDEMRVHLWGAETHVDFDRGLAYSIGQVRTALGDTAENPRFVQTLPKRGFRFIAPVETIEPAAPEEPAPVAPLRPTEPVEAGPPPRRSTARSTWAIAALSVLVAVAVGWTAWARMAPGRPIIAVTTFDNETGSPEYDRLASSAADVMVDRLTALGSDRIGVIGNTPAVRAPRSARDPEAIRKETSAAYLVLGQVQNDPAGIRMVVHLIRLSDATHLWVTRIARPAGVIGEVEDEIGRRLAEAVRLHVVDRDPNAPRFTR
jgi:DNA-binding winged helix-turn-helix (wHTH) protein/TolB-like protein